MESEYPKLVRDNIPDIIQERTGVAPEQRIAADDAEFESFLLKKIVEEAIELQHSAEQNNLEEEIADINEIIQTLMRLRNKKMEDIAAIQEKKREKTGDLKSGSSCFQKLKSRMLKNETNHPLLPFKR